MVLSAMLFGALCLFIGYQYGKRNTVINHTNNYTGAIDKLVINGEVRWIAPQKSAEANQPQPTTAPAQNGDNWKNAKVNINE